MISFLVACMIIVIKCQTTDGLVDPAPVVFGETGQDVTIHSRIEEFTTSYALVSWYLQRPSGKVELIAYFSYDGHKIGRYKGMISESSGNVSLTISNATISDSGRYFAVMRAGLKFTPGSPSDLIVTDSQEDPAMRVFLSGTGEYFCELKGGGPLWGDPKWEITDDGGEPAQLEAKADSFIDEHGVFIRSSTVSMSVEDGDLNVKCMSHDERGGIVLKNVPGKQHGNGACQWLLYLSPLCVVMLLLTVTGAGLWTQRVMKQTHPAQMRNRNGQL